MIYLILGISLTLNVLALFTGRGLIRYKALLESQLKEIERLINNDEEVKGKLKEMIEEEQKENEKK